LRPIGQDGTLEQYVEGAAELLPGVLDRGRGGSHDDHGPDRQLLQPRGEQVTEPAAEPVSCYGGSDRSTDHEARPRRSTINPGPDVQHQPGRAGASTLARRHREVFAAVHPSLGR
jgi:hypothetical protein